MDSKRVKRLRLNLTAHFAVIAWLTAMLVATGSGTVFLPVFIFCVSAAAFVFVDWLEWFEIGRIGSYVGMTTATTIAIASYVYSVLSESESGQLMAVAGLLVYPEAVLFLQRKNLRIYEQLAVFLLLEMIVAALVNDNILFGILLTPIILLWVSSLFLFSRYATLVHLDPSIETPTPKLAEVLFQRFVKTVMGDNQGSQVVKSKIVPTTDAQQSRSLRRMMQSFPIGIGALAFAGLFFYLLPRTSPTSFQTGLGSERSVGLPSTLTFGAVGRILQNNTPVMRVSLKHELTGEKYEIDQPPYLRAMVFDSYGPSHRRRLISRGEWQFSATPLYKRLSKNADARQLLAQGRDLVSVEFDIRRKYVSSMYTVPPAYATSKEPPVKLNHDAIHMLLQRLDESNSVPNGKSLVYEVGSTGFADNQQVPVTPARLEPRRVRRPVDWEKSGYVANLKRGFFAQVGIDQYRQELLQSRGVDETKPVRIAQAIEGHFIDGNEFTYSLDLKPPTDPDIDPIEDFLVNQKSGHCQYFASSMVAMLRQSGIPSRIVVGYRPTELNSYGDYFNVKQSDAHAWVEALFKREHLEGTQYARWLTDSDNYWVRFDPTPATDSQDIIEQRGQAMDYAEKLWKDYVVEGQKLSGENSLYAPVAENGRNAYDDMVARLKRMRTDLESGAFFDFRSIGFAWQIAILVVGLGLAAVGVWQILVIFPRIAPRLARRLGVGKRAGGIGHPFFARCVRLVERLGTRRRHSETPQEFTREAADALQKRGQDAESSLDFLTNLYYRLRFGEDENSATPQERKAIDEELSKLESAVATARR